MAAASSLTKRLSAATVLAGAAIGLVLLSGFDGRGAWRAIRARLAAPPTGGSAWTPPKGRYPARDDALTGAIDFEGAVVALEHGERWKTAPHRIALGREVLARPLALKDADQIELRRIVDDTVAPTALCQGDRPGWIGVVQTRSELTLMVFRAGPAPDKGDALHALCGWWTYRRP